MKAQSQVEKNWILGTKSVEGKKGSWEIPNTLIGRSANSNMSRCQCLSTNAHCWNNKQGELEILTLGITYDLMNTGSPPLVTTETRTLSVASYFTIFLPQLLKQITMVIKWIWFVPLILLVWNSLRMIPVSWWSHDTGMLNRHKHMLIIPILIMWLWWCCHDCKGEN